MLVAPLVGRFPLEHALCIILAGRIVYREPAGYHQPKETDPLPNLEKAWTPNCHRRFLYIISNGA